MIRELGDQQREGIALCNIGIIHLEQSEYREAEENLASALKLSRAAGDKANEGVSTLSLGFLYAHYGDFNKSLEYFDAALGIFRKLGNRYKEAEVLGQI